MNRTDRYPRKILIFDAGAVLLCLMGFVTTMQKADVPFATRMGDGHRLIAGASRDDEPPAHVVANDTIIAVDGHSVTTPRELEHVTDGYAIGDTVTASLLDHAGVRQVRVPLERYYSTRYLIIQLATSAFLFFLGVLVLFKKPTSRDARIFHWVAVCTALLFMLTWGRYAALPLGIGHLLRAVFPAACVFTGATLLHFSILYPDRHPTNMKALLRLMYGISAVLSIAASYTSMRATLPVSMEWASIHIIISSWARILLVGMAVAAIGVFLRSSIRARELSQRKKLRWILLGGAVSILGFATLWQVPQLLYGHGQELITEDAMLLLITIFPLAMTISIIRYHLFDIDTLIHRSTVYSVVFVLLIILFIATQQGLIELFEHLSTGTQRIAALISGMVTIIAFQPVRYLVQRMLDRWFFQIRYSFQQAVRTFFDAIKNTVDAAQLARMLTEKIADFIPVERVGVYLFLDADRQLQLLAQRGIDNAKPGSVREAPILRHADSSLPIAFPEKVEPGVTTNAEDAPRFAGYDMSVVMPLSAESGDPHGYLMLGNKRSGFPFSADDIDLLKTVSDQSGRELQRILLQNRLMEKRAEAERLAELNRMKSFFVATVSHDLKTPLTSIKMFAELIRTKHRHGTVNIDEYLAIIEGECERLTHLINNVLDFSRIEAGMKHYSFTTCDVHVITREALAIMRYPLSLRKFTLDVSLLERECHIVADHDAVLEAMLNIISNAITYSPDTRHIAVTSGVVDTRVAIAIADKGVGIAPEDLPRIFDPFYRASDAMAQNAGGTGLGLALVKHVMDAHNGTVECASTPDDGSTFTLYFPLTV